MDDCPVDEQPLSTLPRHELIQDDGKHHFQASAYGVTALHVEQGRQVSFNNSKDVLLVLMVGTLTDSVLHRKP